ncbi:hypothetical protein ACU4GD_14375 [Cupriavidus basilensis]
MQWRTLTGSSAPAALAANIARGGRGRAGSRISRCTWVIWTPRTAGPRSRTSCTRGYHARINVVPSTLLCVSPAPDAPGRPHLSIWSTASSKGPAAWAFDQVVHDEKTLASSRPISYEVRRGLLGWQVTALPELMYLLPTDRRITRTATVCAGSWLRKPGRARTAEEAQCMSSRRKRSSCLSRPCSSGCDRLEYGTRANYDAYQRRLRPRTSAEDATRSARNLAQQENFVPFCAGLVSAITAWYRAGLPMRCQARRSGAGRSRTLPFLADDAARRRRPAC